MTPLGGFMILTILTGSFPSLYPPGYELGTKLQNQNHWSTNSLALGGFYTPPPPPRGGGGASREKKSEVIEK